MIILRYLPHLQSLISPCITVPYSLFLFPFLRNYQQISIYINSFKIFYLQQKSIFFLKNKILCGVQLQNTDKSGTNLVKEGWGWDRWNCQGPTYLENPLDPTRPFYWTWSSKTVGKTLTCIINFKNPFIRLLLVASKNDKMTLENSLAVF